MISDLEVPDLVARYKTASPADQLKIRSDLGEWRKAKDQEARDAKENHFQSLFTNPEYLRQQESDPALQQAEKLNPSPEPIIIGASNRAFLSFREGRDISGAEYPALRDAYAQKITGKKTVSDGEFFNIVKVEYDTKIAREGAVRDLQMKATAQALQDALDGRQTKLAPAFRQWADANRQLIDDKNESPFLTEAFRSYRGTLADLEKYREPAAQVWNTLTASTQGKAGDLEISKLGEQIASMPRDARQKIFAYAAIAAEANGVDRGAFAQVAKNLGETVVRSFGFVGNFELNGQEAAIRQMAEYLRDPGSEAKSKILGDYAIQQLASSDRGKKALAGELDAGQREAFAKELEAKLPVLRAVRELNDLAKNRIDPIKMVAKPGTVLGTIEQGAYGLAASTGYLAATAVPGAGLMLGFAAYQTDEYNRLLVENPDIDHQAAWALSSVEAAGNALIDKVQLDRIPALAGLAQHVKVNGWGKTLATGGKIWVGQSAQEIAQNGIAPVLETIAAGMRTDMTPKNAGEELAKYLKDVPATLAATGWLALIGAGFASVADFKNPTQEIDSALKFWGFSEDQSARIKAATTPEELDTAIREEMPRRTPENIAAGKELANEAARKVEQDQNDPSKPTMEAITRADGSRVWRVTGADGEIDFETADQTAAEQAYIDAARRTEISRLAAEEEAANSDQGQYEDARNATAGAMVGNMPIPGQQITAAQVAEAQRRVDEARNAGTVPQPGDLATVMQGQKIARDEFVRPFVEAVRSVTGNTAEVIVGQTAANENYPLGAAFYHPERNAIELDERVIDRAVEQMTPEDVHGIVTSLTHEATHSVMQQLRQTNPERFEALESLVNQIPEDARKRYIGRTGNEAPEQIDYASAGEEFLANVAEDHFSGKALEWLPPELRGLVDQVVKIVRDMLAKIKEAIIGSPDTEANVNAIREELGRVFQDAIDGKLASVDGSGETIGNTNPDSARFGRDVDAVLNGTYDTSRMVDVMVTPPSLTRKGVKALPIFTSHNVLKKVVLDKHGIPADIVKRLPELLSRPIAIFRSDTRPKDSIVLVLDASHNGSPLVVALALNQNVGRTQAHVVTSVYAKHRPESFREWVDKGSLLWSDQKKSPEWFQSIGVQFPKEGANQAGGKVEPKSGDVNRDQRRGSHAAIEDAFAKHMKSPDARIRLFERAKEKLIALRDENQAAIEGMKWSSTNTEKISRERMIRSIGELDALLAIFPPEIRGKVGGYTTLTKIGNGEKALSNFFSKRVEMIGEELESMMRREYRGRIEKLLKDSRPKAGDNNVRKSTMGPEAQRVADIAFKASLLDEDGTAEQLMRIDAALGAGWTPELAEEWAIVNSFGDLDNRDAESLSASFHWLRDLVRDGRKSWRIQQENRLEETRGSQRQIVEALGRSDLTTSFAGEHRKQLPLIAKNYLYDHYSFEQFMRAILPEELRPMVDGYAKRMRKADNATQDAEIRAREDLMKALRPVAKAAGKSTARAVIDLKTMHENVAKVLVGRKVANERIKIELAEKIVAGSADSGKLSKADIAELRKELAAIPADSTKEYVTVQRVIYSGDMKPISMSRGQAIQVLLSWRQNDVQDKMRRGGWQDSTISELETFVGADPVAVAAFDFLKEFYGKGAKTVNPVYARMFGMNMPRVNDYAPTRFRHSGEVKDIGPDGTPISSGGTPGFAKGRVSHAAAIAPVDALEVFQGHVADQAHWVHFAEFARDFRAVFANGDVRASIEAAHGRDVLAQLDRWNKMLEQRGGDRAREAAWFNNALGSLISGKAVASLGFNLRSIAMQADSALRFMFATNPKEWVEALSDPGKLAADMPKVWYSDTVQRRLLGGLNPEQQFLLRRAAAKPGIGSQIAEVSTAPLRWADAVLTTVSGAVVYRSAYNEAISSGANTAIAEKAALDALDASVYRYSQPVGVGSKSLIENNSNAVTRMIMMFMSDPRLKSSLMLEAAQGLATGKGDWKQHLKTIATIEATALLSHIIASAYRDAFSDDNDEDIWSLGGFVQAAALAPLQGYFLLGAVTEAALSKMTGQGWYAPARDPLVEMAQRGIRAASHLEDAIAFDDPKAMQKEWENIARTMAINPGLAAPAAMLNLLKPAIGLSDNLKSEE